MEKKIKKPLLGEQLGTLQSAAAVLRESYKKVEVILKKNTKSLSVEERESCEALTARFSRLCDFIFQKSFRTLDQVELQDEGTAIDRLNRMEKRGVIPSALRWRELRELRNEIAHEYLIEASDLVLSQAFQATPELLDAVTKYQAYLKEKKYI